MGSARGVVPIRVVEDDTISPPRRVVVVRPGHTPPGKTPGLMLAPVTAWVFGLRMNWREVTEENLRWIPGISRTMAGRLVRIRDTMDVKDFRQVGAYPRVGEKTVKRLQRYCFIPHAN